MVRLALLTRVAILLAIYSPSVVVHALTIETLFVPAGKIINGIGEAKAPPPSIGGGNLNAIVRAAANVWEDLIADEHTVTLNFGWAPTGSVSSIAFHQGLSAQGNPMREQLGSLAFNSNYSAAAPLFLDPTPWASEEFVVGEQRFENFGGGTVEIMRDYAITNPTYRQSRDLYSTALHEIGHALGLARWAPFVEETSIDQDIDITSGDFAGSAIPIAKQHLLVEGPNMTHQSHPPGRRREVTQVDLLAVCELSQFSACNLSLRPMYPNSDSNRDGDVDGHDYLAWQVTQQADALSTVDLAGWKSDYGSPLHAFGDFDHDREIGGDDFLEWQRGESPQPRGAADLELWQENFGSPLYAVGDYNHDRTIDGGDFLAWQRGRSPNPLSQTDLVLWRSNLARKISTLAGVAIPEPTSLAISLLAVVALLARLR